MLAHLSRPAKVLGTTEASLTTKRLQEHLMADRTNTTSPSRRLFLAAGSATAVFGALGVAAATEPDAELVALDIEIRRLAEKARLIQVERVDPVEHDYRQSFYRGAFRLTPDERYEASRKFAIESGREAAVKECNGLHDQVGALWDRMKEIPAKTQAGRAAKVRALLVGVMGAEWRGEEVDDWSYEQARNLFADFAGMTAVEIAAV